MCTCYVGHKNDIRYCPLHSAASKMLTACKAIRALIEVRNDIPESTDEIFRTLHRLADEVIGESDKTSPGRAEQISTKPQDATEAKS